MSNVFGSVSNINCNWIKDAFKLRCNDIYKQIRKEETYGNLACLNCRVMTGNKKKQNYISKFPQILKIIV